MIIDFRVRPPVGKFAQAAMYARPDRTAIMASALNMPTPPSLQHASVDATLHEMDEAGIDLAVIPVRRGSQVLGDVTNGDVAEVVRLHRGRFIGLGAPNLADTSEGLDELDAFASQPEFAGAVVEPGLWQVPLYGDDRRLYPIYEKCARLGLPLLIMGGGNAGPDITYSSPTIVDHIAADFPSLTVIAAHGGWPWVHEILHVAFRRPNLLLSPDMYLFGMAGWRDYVDAGNGYLQDRFLFGTAYPFVPLKEGLQRFRELFRPEVLPKLTSENARRVLKLPNPE
ncbi:MAG: amidohydrolase family protein [Chloroflexota bacterium]